MNQMIVIKKASDQPDINGNVWTAECLRNAAKRSQGENLFFDEKKNALCLMLDIDLKADWAEVKPGVFRQPFHFDHKEAPPV